MLFNKLINKFTNQQTQQIRALVTGAYGGIGTALCHQLVEQGADVYLVGRNHDRLRVLKQALDAKKNSGQVIHSFCVDIANCDDLSRLDTVLSAVDARVNVLINNAGISHFGLFESTPDEIMSEMLNVNVLAQMRLTQTLLPRLKDEPWARIINVGSVFGSLGFPGFNAYCASKFALRGFSESLARELSDTPISIGYFTARATDTPLNTGAVVDMNKALKTPVDAPEVVATKLLAFIYSHSILSRVAWPETIFMRVNALAPNWVSQSIRKRLPVIKRFAVA